MRQPASRSLLVPSLGLLWLVVAAGTYFGWIRGANHRDFYPRWAGARLALFEGRDLYADSTTLSMQQMLYGRELDPSEDPQAFAYPAILVPLLLPFWLIPDVELATAAWEATSVLIVLGVLSLLARSGGRTPGWLPVLFLVWYYTTLMVFQGQVTALPLAALGLGWWAYTREHDLMAGAVLVIGFVKPEQVLVPVAALLLIAFINRRWAVIKGFTIAGFALLLFSMLINGWWLPGWISAVERYAAYAQTSWAPGTVWALSPVLGAGFVLGVTALLWLVRGRSGAIYAAAIPLGMIVLPQTLIWGLTLLSVPLVLAWRKGTGWVILSLWLLGWLMVAVSGIDRWWQIQNALMPLLTLAAVAYASGQTCSPLVPLSTQAADPALQPTRADRYNRLIPGAENSPDQSAD